MYLSPTKSIPGGVKWLPHTLQRKEKSMTLTLPHASREPFASIGSIAL